MGATWFEQVGITNSTDEGPKDVFDRLVQDARWEYGHGGYSGTIAEKHGFTHIPRPARKSAHATADALRKSAPADHPVHDKWGPAVCVTLSPAETTKLKRLYGRAGSRGTAYLFFGWASI